MTKKVLSEEHKRKIGLSLKGNPALKEAGRKGGAKSAGRTLSEEQKIIKSLRNKNNPKLTGKNHWNWKGGITNIRKKLYFSDEYKLWRKAVFERDKYTCIWCGQTGGKLAADHIKSWANYPELRLSIDNGRTLCLDCHKKTTTYGVHKKSQP